MKLLEVLDNIDFKLIAGDLNKEITSVEYDSRKVAVGSLFVCVQGFTVDGHSYASMAAEKGASAIVVDKNRSCLNEDETRISILPICAPISTSIPRRNLPYTELPEQKARQLLLSC